MSALAVSQIQKHFIANEIYKRSKRYFDVIKLKSIEHQDSKYRRIPSTNVKEQLQKKIGDSFISSEEIYNKKRLQEIQKSKQKCSSFYILDDTDQTQTNYTVAAKKNPLSGKKTFDMSKGLSRQFMENLQNQTLTSIQDPFNNFTSSDFSKGQKAKSIDFNKILGRKDTISKQFFSKKNLKPIETQNPQQNKQDNTSNKKKQNKVSEINKAYQKFYFDQSKFKCLIDVQKQRKAQHRKNHRTSLKGKEPNQIPFGRIQKARNLTHRNPVSSSLIFYHGKGKQEPSQMHFKVLKNNQSYWMDQVKQMKKQDFETVKRRQEMIDKRLKQIKARRQVVDERGEICDAKYFLRNKNY